MIAWLLFFSIVGASIICTLRFVPTEYRRKYASYREDWLAAGLFNSIWIVAVVQCAVASSVPPPLFLRTVGAALMIGGHALVIWARRVNPFFVPAIVAPDYIVTTGPYSRIYHPGYTGLALVASGACFLLGEPWAFFPAFIYLCLLARRIHVEERLLSNYFQ